MKVLEEQGKVILSKIPKYCKPNWHISYLRVSTERMKDLVLDRLKRLGIGATFHFIPLHSSPFRKEEVSESRSTYHRSYKQNLNQVPLYPELTKDEQDYIINSIHNILLGERVCRNSTLA